MNRRTARSILFSALLLVSAITIILSNYGAVSIDVNALIPFVAGTCNPITTAGITFTPVTKPDIELSQWSGPPGTPVNISGCGFDTTLDAVCTVSSLPSGVATSTSCGVTKTNGIVVASLIINPAQTPGIYVTIQVSGCVSPGPCVAGGAGTDTATASFFVSYVSTTVSTSTSTTTTVVSTSYSTLTTTTHFFSTLTTTTISSIGRSTETDFYVTLITVTAAASTLLTTISQTLTTSITALSTTFTTETVVQTSPATTSALMVGPVQNFYPDGLAVVAVLLLSGWLVLRRIIT